MAMVNRGANPLPQSSFALFAGASPSDIDTFGGAKDGTFHDRPDSGVQKVTFLGPDGVLALQPLASIPDLAQFITNNLLASVMTGNVFPIGPYGLYIHTHNGYAGITWAKGEFPVTALPVNPDEGSVPILTRSHSQHVTNMLPYAVQVRLSPQELEDAKRSLSGLQTVQLSVAKQIDASVKTTLCTIAMSAFSEVPDAIRAASVAQQSPLHLWSPVTFFHALKRVHGCASRGDGGMATALGWVRQLREELFLPETNVMMLHATTAALLTMDNREAFLGGQEGLDRFKAGVPGLTSFRGHTIGVASTYRTADLAQGGNVLESGSRTGEFYIGHDPSIGDGPLVAGMDGNWDGVSIYNEDMDGWHTVRPEEMVRHALWWAEGGTGPSEHLEALADEYHKGGGEGPPPDPMIKKGLPKTGDQHKGLVRRIGDISPEYLDIKTIFRAALLISKSDELKAATHRVTKDLNARGGLPAFEAQAHSGQPLLAAREEASASSAGGASGSKTLSKSAKSNPRDDASLGNVPLGARPSDIKQGRIDVTKFTQRFAHHVEVWNRQGFAGASDEEDVMYWGVLWLAVPFATMSDHLALIHAGLPYPLQFMLIRDDIRRVMASAIIYKQGCGATLVSHIQATNGMDVQIGISTIVYRWRAGTLIVDDKEIQILPHVSHISYSGGKGVEFAKPSEWIDAVRRDDRNPRVRGDIYVVGQRIGACRDMEYCSLLGDGAFDLKGYLLHAVDRRNPGGFEGWPLLYRSLQIGEAAKYRQPREQYMQQEAFNVNLARGTARSPEKGGSDIWSSGTASFDGPAFIGQRDVHEGKALNHEATQRLLQTRTASGR